jgi:hypothetical protein
LSGALTDKTLHLIHVREASRENMRDVRARRAHANVIRLPAA